MDKITAVFCLLPNLLQAEYLYDNTMTAAGTKFVFAHFNGRICDYHPILHIITPINDSVEISIQTPIWNSTDSLDNVYHLTSEKKKLDIRLPLALCIEGAHQSSKTVLVNATKSIFVFVSDIQSLKGDYFIIYPVQTLGSEYVASGYTSDNNVHLAIIGCISLYDDTEVTVIVPTNQNCTYNKTSYPGGSQIHVSLSMYQNVRINGFDVTGSFIKSNKPISVFSGHEFTWVPGPTRSNGLPTEGKDKMMAQLPPISTMSTIYPIVSTQINDEEWVRVIALHDNTSFFIYNETSNLLHSIELNGSFYEFSIPRASAATIVSEKPVNVVQYSASGDDTGDPRMMITLSLDNYVSEYMFVVPTEDVSQHFSQLLVIIATNSSLDRIFIDDTKLTESGERSGQTSCHYANLLAVWLAVREGTHHVQCNLIENEYCTVYIHGYSNNNQYGTEANRYIGSLDTVKSAELKRIESIEHGNSISRLYKKCAINKKPSMSPQLTLTDVTSIYCHTVCSQYGNCAVTVFDTNDFTCELYPLYATSDTLQDKDGVIMSIVL